MAAPTIQAIALSLLRMLGISSLDPNVGENSVTDGDIADVAMIMTQAYQIIWALAPGEQKRIQGSGVLHAPTSVTLSVTNGSTSISSVATWASWMEGCTIRINGDSQDNEILSSTALSRPYVGSTGSVSATVYGDCITVDGSIENVISPMTVGNQYHVTETQSRADFARLGLWKVQPNAPYSLSFWAFGEKPLGTYPNVFFVEGFYDSSLDYVKRRIRFSPMPVGQLPVAYTANSSPPRVTSDDILSGSYSNDPGAKIPMLNANVESVFLPIAMQLLTRLATFKNSEAKPEIARQFQQAINILKDSKASVGSIRGVYI
jgi:hypothetical protein